MWQEMDNRVYWTVDYVTGDGQSSLLKVSCSWLMWQEMDNRVYWTVDYVEYNEQTGDG